MRPQGRGQTLFFQNIAQAIDAAHPSKLDDISRAIWRGMGAGAISDDQAQELAERIHAKRAIAGCTEAVQGRSHRRSIFPPRRYHRAPKRPAAIERRRKLAASGPLPPALACHFTTGELAVLRIVGDEARAKGSCHLDLAQIATRAGVCRSHAQATLRKAERQGLLSIAERRRPGRKNLPNVVTVVSREWVAWGKRGPLITVRSQEGGGSKKSNPYRIQSNLKTAVSDSYDLARGLKRPSPSYKSPQPSLIIGKAC